MLRDIKDVIRFSMENSDGTSDTTVDPEKVKWLREVLSSTSVDLSKRLKDDITLLSQMLESSNVDKEDSLTVLEELIVITEDLDFANDFYKMGGTKLLTNMLFNGPNFLMEGAYCLLAQTTQNNPYAQEICLKENILRPLICRIHEEENLSLLKNLLLSISCLTRSHVEGLRVFQEENGFQILLHKMVAVSSRSLEDNAFDIKRVLAKGAFFIYCLLQELPPSTMNEKSEHELVDKLVELMVKASEVEEHLVASLVLILSGYSTVQEAIDMEDVPQSIRMRCSQLVSPHTLSTLNAWIKSMDEKTDLCDPANAELRTYTVVLKRLLNI